MLEDLRRAHGLPVPPVIRGQPTGFRLRARLAVRGRVGSPKVGLFELDSHRVVHVPNCRVHHPLINHVAAVVRRALVDTRMTSYSDKARMGVARYLQIVVERSSQSAQVVLVANCETPEPVSACLDMIRERLGSDLHSLWFNPNRTIANTILSSDFVKWHGPDSVVEHFGGAAVHYPPGAFGQSNLGVAEKIVGHLRAQIPQGARVLELYAGVGAIALSVLSNVERIIVNEVNANSLRGLELGLARLDAGDRVKVSVVPGDAVGVVSMAGAQQVLIADPPRKGLGPALIEEIRNNPPEVLLYVSCGIDSLRDDAARLVSSGKIRLAGLSVFDQMPYTEHIETVARFERV